MDKLLPAIRSYSWGSRTLIPALLGQEPGPNPVAELWYGAHPGDPSHIESTGQSLVEKLAPEQLPYLVKLLAAGEVLSLQAHPSMEQAQEGFARENEQGLALNASNRTYKDPFHKPEIIIALTPFYAMAGFRPLAKTKQLFDALQCEELERYTSMLSLDAESTSLRALFTTWITIPAQTRQELIDAIVEAASRVPAGWMSQVMQTVVDINEQYPGDIGVLGALLLNHVKLAPGEAVFLPAGNLHAYVKGLGVEVMANSDNVLRGGLTPKYVDVPELVKVLEFEAVADPRVETRHEGVVTEYLTPVDEFVVRRMDVGKGAETSIGSQAGHTIALCTQGEIACADLQLRPGEAAWIPAHSPEVTLAGDGQVFVTTTRTS